MVTRRHLLRRLDREQVVEAIRRAEQRTSGEIRVSVSTLIWGDVERAARRAFVRLGMHAAPERNAVLFFVVPARRKCVVWGDAGIHEKVGEPFWRETVEQVTQHFRKGGFTDGLVAGIRTVGERLSAHFPPG